MKLRNRAIVSAASGLLARTHTSEGTPLDPRSSIMYFVLLISKVL